MLRMNYSFTTALSNSSDDFNLQRTAEKQIEFYKILKHEVHWVYDFDNRI